MKILKSHMTGIPPINAMHYKKHLNKVEMAAKIGKRIPHPVVQKVSHATDLAVKAVKEIDNVQSSIRKKRKPTAPSI